MTTSTSEYLDRLPPNSAEAERGVLGCIMLSPLEGLEYCASFNVQPETFFDLRNRTIYQGMVRLCMAGKPLDIISVQQHLKDRKELDGVGGVTYISELSDGVPGIGNITHYISILLEKGVARQAIALCTETVSSAFDHTPEVWLAKFRDRVTQLRIGSSVVVRCVGELVKPLEDDPTELLKHRFLCECGGLLINGPTGMGKSSALMQAFALWSNNLPFFGIQPAKPLTALLIQAENDDGDLAEMRDGICEGCKFTQEQRSNFFNRVKVVTSNGSVGQRFCNEVIQPALSAHKPNLLGIDPANSFIGGDTKEQKDVGAFLRTWLNPLIHAHRCGVVIAHHTNKPATGKEKPNWRNGELAYTGSGSAEWANWARAVLAIQDTGTHGIYRLHAAKRGVRLHWRDDKDEKIYEKLIGHATDGHIYWRDAQETEIKDDGGRPKSYDDTELLDLLGEFGLTTADWAKEAELHCRIKGSTFDRAVRRMSTSNQILKSKIDRKWKPIL